MFEKKGIAASRRLCSEKKKSKKKIVGEPCCWRQCLLLSGSKESDLEDVRWSPQSSLLSFSSFLELRMWCAQSAVAHTR